MPNHPLFAASLFIALALLSAELPADDISSRLSVPVQQDTATKSTANVAAPSISDDSHIEVHFQGIGTDLGEAMLQNLRASVSLNHRHEQPLSEARIRFLHQRAPEEIRQALKVFGFYTPLIDTRLEQTATGWQAFYRIDPGEPVLIERVEVEFAGDGADSKAFVKLREEQPFVVGRRLEHQTYSNYKSRIENRALELGYFDGQFVKHQMRVDTAAKTAAIALEFNTGPRYHFGPVSFGRTPFSEEFLRNYIPFEPGQPYNSTDPLKLRQRLIDSGMFSSVEVRPDETRGGDREVPVEVVLTPRKPNRYIAGIGFATDTGPRLRLGWEARYLNEHGYRFNSDLRLSPITSKMTGTFLMPYFHNRQADVGIRSALIDENTETSESRSGQLTLFQNTERFGWNETLSASYLVEDFEVAGVRDTSKLLIPAVSWWKSWSDDPIYARRGGQLSLDIKGAAEPVLSDISFIQARIAGKYVRALGWRNRVLARLEFGVTEVSDFDQLPASLRFFAGGDNSIRGYDYQSLGPKNAAGKVVGGRYLIVGSLEYEQFVYKNYGVAAFVDFGNAVNDLSDPLEVGTGIGLRWLSPIGLIKFDVAVGVTEPDKPIRIHITLGSNL